MNHLRSIFLGSNVNKPSKILIKTLNTTKYIELDVQNIEAPRIDDLKMYLQGSLKGVLEAIKVCRL